MCRHRPALVAELVCDERTDAVSGEALADARRLGLVRTNAAADVELPTVRRGDLRAWDGDQIGRFLRHVEHDRLGPLWRFLIATGVRRGEALGLRWSDVDLEGRSVTIRRSRVVASGRVVEGPTEDEGRETVDRDRLRHRWRTPVVEVDAVG